MIQTLGLTHIALSVKDVERSFAFYEKLLGVVRVYHSPGFIQAQTPGSRDVLVFEENARLAGTRGGMIHFGFRLMHPADIDAAVDAVQGAGGGQIRTGSFTPEEPYVFFTDPDGYEVELWYESPTTQDPRGTG